MFFKCAYFLINMVGSGVQLGPLGITATNRPTVAAPGDYDDGEIGGMMTGRGNRSTWRKLPQCRFVHQKLHMPARTRTRPSSVGSQRLTACTTARPKCAY
jgi:hypothetical protein